jgi:hypothetical protein
MKTLSRSIDDHYTSSKLMVTVPILADYQIVVFRYYLISLF